jgi:hypothetical protein
VIHPANLTGSGKTECFLGALLNIFSLFQMVAGKHWQA